MSAKDTSIDQSILELILQNLVTEPDKVIVERVIDEQGVLLTVQVDEKDMGIVIGRQGSMANAIKTLIRAIGKANQMMIRVQFKEPDGSLKYSQAAAPHHVHEDDTITDQERATSEQMDQDLKEFEIN